MEAINDAMQVRMTLLKETWYNVETAQKCWDFVRGGDEAKKQKPSSDRLAEAFTKVIRLTNANPDMVVEQLINECGLPESLKESTHDNIDYVTWHKPDVVPDIKEPICVVFEDDSEKPFVINDIIDDNEWEHFVNDKKPKQWCYLKEVLREGYKL